MQVVFAPQTTPKTGTVIVGVLEGGKLDTAAATLDKASSGMLRRALKAAPKFEGKRGQILDIPAPAGLRLDRIIVLGVGKSTDLTASAAEDMGGDLIAYLNRQGISEAVAMMGLDGDGSQRKGKKQKGETPGDSEAMRAAAYALGAYLRAWRFAKYRTKDKPGDKMSVKKLTFTLTNPDQAKREFTTAKAVAEGVFMTRNLVSEPPNVIYPESFAAECQELTALGVKVEVLGVKQMQALGMNALLGVGQGSARESQMVVMQWKGDPRAKKDAAPFAVVGKGVTFDTGGISLKPGDGMWDMKWDMAGAGTVAGLMRALAGRKAKANVVGLCGMVENMPDGKAQRPGDIVKSMSGQSIEVLNTDAEGRLVLADVLWYCQTRFKPAAIVDLATLTGAIIISLGNEYAGLFSNDDALSADLTTAGNSVGEKLWRLPLHDNYNKMINTDAADMKNISGGRAAGSITAAQFLQRFIKDTPWAHLDIAGVAWSTQDKGSIPKGATAFGVRLLDRLIATRYERS